jgi:hypothetical protein
MALYKEIELKSGVVVSYHRIVSINKITNHSTILEVASYISQSKREEEIQQLATGEELSVFLNTEYMSVTYDETANITDWYEYLKTTDKYSGATNI